MGVADQVKCQSPCGCVVYYKGVYLPDVLFLFFQPQFVPFNYICVRLWLGVTLFPLSPLCTCLSSIDSFGDHLLGCSHGPTRIRCHDTLVNIIYNALSQDNPGVLKEQRASYDDGLWPGDIFHPDFQHGRSAYFDGSVRSTI